jgi:hypothetical protein
LLHWLSEQRKLPDGVMPLSIADFVISHFARQPGRMHTTHAVGLLHLEKNDWHYQAFERIGLGDLWWPELAHDLNPVAQWKRNHRCLTIHGSFGDQQSALYGAGLESNELSINIATGSQVSIRTAEFHPGPYQTRKYFGGDCLNTIIHSPAHGSLNAITEWLTEQADAETIQSIADHLESAGKRLDPQQGWRRIVLSGGLSQSHPRLAQWIQERLRAPIRESIGEETLFGLLRLAREHNAHHSPIP